MRILYDETVVTTHRFKINQGGELLIRVNERGIGGGRDVEIIFEDGKFKECHFPFSGLYTRSHWHILAGINATITELEARYAAPYAQETATASAHPTT